MMKLALDRMETVSREAFGEDAGKLDRYIETNRKQIAALLDMTDVFIQIADLRPPHFAPTNLNIVIRNVLDKYADSFSDTIAVHLKLAEEIPNVRADEKLMEVVFENLLSNAIEAVGEKGTIDVATNLEQRFQVSPVNLGTKNYVQLEISDTGTGIPQEEIGKLFDRFFSRREGGTGLGLAIVKKIVDDHHGLIHVESAVGVGSTFTVSIPVW